MTEVILKPCGCSPEEAVLGRAGVGVGEGASQPSVCGGAGWPRP